MTASDQPNLERLIAAKDVPALAAWAAHAASADIADVLQKLEEWAAAAQVFAHLPPDRQPDVFRHLRFEAQHAISGQLDRRACGELLDALETDDRTRFVEQLPGEEERQHALELLGPDSRRELARQLQYPPDSIGRLMSLTFAAVPDDLSLAAALERLRAADLDADAISTVYVTAADGRLVDALELPRFVLGDPAAPVRDIMDGIYVSITPHEDREAAVGLMQKHDLLALPVVDHSGMLVGIVSIDDVMDVAREEATEDFQKQAGMAPLRATYPEVAAWSLFTKRLPWLAALIFVYLGASGVISAFEDALASELVLAAFIPLLMGSGGNVGAQSGTLVVRALAVGDLEGGRWRQALSKELGVGIVLGLALGILAGVVAQFRGGGDVALVVGSSMLLIVITANLTGTLLPVLLARLGIDPAVAGSPVITSITDLTSLLIYLGIASRLLAVG